MKANWSPWLRPERRGLWRADKTYASSFISRPDFFGRPFGLPYWSLLRSVWENRPVLAVVSERMPEKKLALFNTAARVGIVRGPARNAWSEYERIRRDCLEWAEAAPEGVVCAMLGPTATVLCHDLAVRGVQALDLGKAPRFYLKEKGLACERAV